jgi:peptide methionine sulfoxide reductase MsrB
MIHDDETVILVMIDDNDTVILVMIDDNDWYTWRQHKQAIKQAIEQALEQALNRQRALMRTRSDCVYSTGITAKTAGSKDRYRSISGWQPYIVPLAHAHISMNRL